MSFCAKACSRLIRVSQLASRQNRPPPARTGGIRGTLVPSLKVARTTSNWFSMPQMPPLSGPISSWLWNSPPRKVALRVDRLVQLERRRRIRRAHACDILAGVAGEAAVNEAVEFGVVGGCFEPERPRRPAQSDLDRLGGFQTQIGIADIEGGGGVVRAARKQFGGLGCALDILRGDAGNQLARQILDQAD